ncbi:MAG: hypothetical protein GY861_18240 [bacterium]|nr:hypothetical protein [bacterium]
MTPEEKVKAIIRIIETYTGFDLSKQQTCNEVKDEIQLVIESYDEKTH